MTAQVRAIIARQAAELRALRPIRSAGILTSRTTRGVYRTPTAKAAVVRQRPTEATIPRWG